MTKIIDFYCDEVLSGRLPIRKVAETERCLAFHHTKPSWSLHIVIIPKSHLTTLSDVQDFSLISEIFTVISDIVKVQQLETMNYKVITNGGTFQDTKHLHFHLVAGTPLNNVTREP